MGQFANTLFQLLLGWVQNAVSSLWSMIVSPDSNGGLRWLLEHWLGLLLLLCIAGALIDFVVYLLRWQPYRVWRAFLHSGRRHSTQRTEEEAQPYQRKWAYADGTTTLEDLRNPPAQPAPEQGEQQLELPVRPVRRIARYNGTERAYYQPVYPQTWKHAAKDSEGESQ